MRDHHLFRDVLTLTPDLLREHWSVAQIAAIGTLIHPELHSHRPIGAKQVLGIVLREAYYDLLAITGAVLLHWFATKQQPSSATAQAALLLLRRETIPDSGNTLLEPGALSKPVFQIVFDLLVRAALHSPFDETKYSADLEGLIQVLNDMATPRMVPGRIYGGFVLGGFQTLAPEFLLSEQELPHDDNRGVVDLIQRLLTAHPEFQADKTVRDFEYQFKQYGAALAGHPDQRFAATVECFVTNPDLVTLRSRLKAIFDEIVCLLRAVA